MFFPFDALLMREALEEARLALREGEIPVGAVIARGDRVIARAHNTREAVPDPTAHAEVLAIRRAAEALGTRRLSECTLYVTLEPCAMCAGAVTAARLGRVVYGAYDPLRGCAGSLYRIPEDPAMDWYCPCEGGVLADECGQLLAQTRFAGREKDRKTDENRNGM